MNLDPAVADAGADDEAAVTALVAAAATLSATAKEQLVRRLTDLLHVERARAEAKLPPAIQRDLQLIAALRSVADALGHPPATTDYIAAYKRTRAHGDESLPSVSVFIRRYGTWKAALFAAGVMGTPPRDLIRQRRLLRGRVSRYPRERLLECVRGCAADLGRVPSIRDYDAWREEKRLTAVASGRVYPDFPHGNTISKRLDGWSNTLRQAGFDDRLDQRNPPDWWTPIDPETEP